MKTIETTEIYKKWKAALRDQEACDRIDKRIDRVTFGNFGDHKGVGGGIIELRIHYGPGYRVYLIEKRGELIVLLAGGTKKSQASDIARAIQLAKAY